MGSVSFLLLLVRVGYAGKHGASISIMGQRKQVVDSVVSSLRSLGISVNFSFQIFVFS